MEYRFLLDSNKILRVKSETPFILSGHQTYIEETKQYNAIHNFNILSLYKEDKDSEGNFYYWYYIDGYSKTLDYSPSLRKENSELKSKLDYLSMMSGVNIPEEEVEIHGQA